MASNGAKRAVFGVLSKIAFLDFGGSWSAYTVPVGGGELGNELIMSLGTVVASWGRRDRWNRTSKSRDNKQSARCWVHIEWVAVGVAVVVLWVPWWCLGIPRAPPGGI